MGTWGSDFAALDFNFSSDAPVGCMLCPESFTVNQDAQPFLQHLLETHRLVIGEVEQVADLRQYVLYWGKLRHLELRDYCIIFCDAMKTGNTGHHSPTNTYYLLCDKLPEDYKLRRSLRQMKLKHVVEQKEKECQDVSYSRLCIYCSGVVGGGVTNCLQHLTQQHGFSLGNPNNIVYGAELLDIVHGKLKNLQCLCCEKIFKTPNTLRDHMRKQQHRCLNPRNKMYDKFYLRNYLRPGTPWEETKRDLDEESDTESMNGAEVERLPMMHEGAAWTDWTEVTTLPTTCLFCPFTTTKVPQGLYSHMQVHHGFDFESITRAFTFYQRVKVINFARTCVLQHRCLQCQVVFSDNKALQQHMTQAAHSRLPRPVIWDLPQYHFPVLENDGLLQQLEDDGLDGPQQNEDSNGCTPATQREQMVFPEDIQPFSDSILIDSSVRKEIMSTQGQWREDEDDEDLVVQCLFCCFTVPGQRAHLQIYTHMRTLHCFDFPEVVTGLSYYTQVKLVNYMRMKAAQRQCHVCCQVFSGRRAMEEHRVLASHNALPPTHFYQDQCWLKPTLEGDGLLQRLREEGESDDEDPNEPDKSRKEVVFGEDVQLPKLTNQLRALKMELQ